MIAKIVKGKGFRGALNYLLGERGQIIGGNIAGATNSALGLSSITSGDAGNYDCVITNSCGSVTSRWLRGVVNRFTTGSASSSKDVTA